jgi:Tfp pilus assembly protein PilN
MIAMRAIQLDYQRNSKPIPWMGLWLLVGALAGAAMLGNYYLELNQRVTSWETKSESIRHVTGLDAKALQPTMKKSAREQVLEVQHANLVLRQLNLPWDAMFKALESSGSRTVALLSLEPNTEKGTIKISGEAKNFTAMLDYVRQLGQRDVFSNVYLQNHQVQQDDPEKPIRFSLLAAWKLDSP